MSGIRKTFVSAQPRAILLCFLFGFRSTRGSGLLFFCSSHRAEFHENAKPSFVINSTAFQPVFRLWCFRDGATNEKTLCARLPRLFDVDNSFVLVFGAAMQIRARKSLNSLRSRERRVFRLFRFRFRRCARETRTEESEHSQVSRKESVQTLPFSFSALRSRNERGRV